MPNYFYMNDDGAEDATNETVFTSLQTGLWSNLAAADVYKDLADVLNTGKITDIADGDFIVMAVGSIEATTAGITNTIPDGVTILTVDEAEIQTPLASSVFNINKSTAGADLTFNGSFYNYGMGISADDNIFINGTQSKKQTWNSATIEINGGGDILRFCNAQDSVTTLINCSVTQANAGAPFINATSGDGAQAHFIGGSIALSSSTYLFSTIGSSNGCRVSLTGTALSGFTTYLVNSNNIPHHLTMRECKVDISLLVANYTRLKGNIWDIQGCGDTADASWQFYYSDGENVAETTSAFYADDAPTFEVDSQAASLKITTDANCSPSNPFIFPLPSEYIALSNTASDALSHEILSTNADLEDVDLQIQIFTKDNTNKFDIETTGAPTIPTATGVNLTTSTVNWNGGSPAGKTKYKIVTDTNGSSADGVPVGFGYVTYPNAVIYLSPVADITGV